MGGRCMCKGVSGYEYVYVCVCVCMCVCVCVCVSMNVGVCMCVGESAWMGGWTYVCMHTYVYKKVEIQNTCMCIFVYLFISQRKDSKEVQLPTNFVPHTYFKLSMSRIKKCLFTCHF